VDDIFIHELRLPMTVHAATVPDSNGDYTIIVNSDLSTRAKRKAAEHELVHIKKEHFYQDCLDIADEENEANDMEICEKVKSCIKEFR